MARFLVLWSENPNIRFPEDPAKSSELAELMFAAIDGFLQSGLLEDFGYFPDGTTGYAICKGEAEDIFSGINLFQPYILCEVCQEIIPYKKGKEIMRALLKQLAAASQK